MQISAVCCKSINRRSCPDLRIEALIDCDNRRHYRSTMKCPSLLVSLAAITSQVVANSDFSASCLTPSIQLLPGVGIHLAAECPQGGQTPWGILDLDICLGNSNGNLVHEPK